MIVYGVVSAETEKVVELFPSCHAAQAMIEERRYDEPELVAELQVAEINLTGDESSPWCN